MGQAPISQSMVQISTEKFNEQPGYFPKKTPRATYQRFECSEAEASIHNRNSKLTRQSETANFSGRDVRQYSSNSSTVHSVSDLCFAAGTFWISGEKRKVSSDMWHKPRINQSIRKLKKLMKHYFFPNKKMKITKPFKSFQREFFLQNIKRNYAKNAVSHKIDFECR